MYTKIKQWFINLFSKPKQAPVADRVEPVVDVRKEGGIHILATKDVIVESNKFYTSNKIITDVPITAKRPPAPKAPPPKKYANTHKSTSAAQQDINNTNLLTQAVVASVILSDTPSTYDYGYSSRSSSSSSSYDSISSDSSSSSSGCD